MSDYPPGEMIIEGQFIESDLKDIELTPKEQNEISRFDALSSATKTPDDDPRPMGKRVY